MYKKFRRMGCAVIGCHRTPRPKAVQGKRVVYITCSEHRQQEEDAAAYYREISLYNVHMAGGHVDQRDPDCQECQKKIRNICGCQGGGE